MSQLTEQRIGRPDRGIHRNATGWLLAAATVAMCSASLQFAAPAYAFSGPTFAVMNTSETPPDGVYFRNSPHTADTSRIYGLGVFSGDRVQLNCYAWGDAVGAYNNTLWYYANNVTRPTVPSSGAANVGYLNAHYVNDGLATNQIDAGVPQCGSGSGSTGGSSGGGTTSPTYVNGVNVGYPSNSLHAWGYCNVIDYNGGPSGHVIVSNTAGTHVVRNGMLWGWFDNGGGPGGLRCPTTDEYAWNTGVRQDFQGGSLFWHAGMDHAVLTSGTALTAINWAAAHLNQNFDSTWCYTFVHDAYAATGKDIGRYPTADNAARHHALNASTTPPPGAVVFWYGTPDSKEGHAALSVGGGYAISTSERQYTLVHVLSIAERNAYPKPYAGWYMP